MLDLDALEMTEAALSRPNDTETAPQPRTAPQPTQERRCPYHHEAAA